MTYLSAKPLKKPPMIIICQKMALGTLRKNLHHRQWPSERSERTYTTNNSLRNIPKGLTPQTMAFGTFLEDLHHRQQPLEPSEMTYITDNDLRSVPLVIFCQESHPELFRLVWRADSRAGGKRFRPTKKTAPGGRLEICLCRNLWRAYKGTRPWLSPLPFVLIPSSASEASA